MIRQVPAFPPQVTALLRIIRRSTKRNLNVVNVSKKNLKYGINCCSFPLGSSKEEGTPPELSQPGQFASMRK